MVTGPQSSRDVHMIDGHWSSELERWSLVIRVGEMVTGHQIWRVGHWSSEMATGPAPPIIYSFSQSLNSFPLQLSIFPFILLSFLSFLMYLFFPLNPAFSGNEPACPQLES